MKSALLWAALFFVPSVFSMNPQQFLTQVLLKGSKIEEIEDRLQIDVFNQNGKLGTKTDCGYYALFNGLTIAQLIQETSALKREHLLTDLTTFDNKKNSLFGTSAGSWKSLIIERATRSQKEQEIRYRLLKCVRVLRDKKEYRKEELLLELKNEGQEGNPLLWIPSILGGTICFKAPCKTENEQKMFCKIESLIQKVAQLITEPKNSLEVNLQAGTILVTTIDKFLAEALEYKIESNRHDKEELEIYQALKDAGINSFFDIKDIVLPQTGNSNMGTWLKDEEIELLNRQIITQALFPDVLKENRLFVLGGSPISVHGMKYDYAVRDEHKFTAFLESFKNSRENELAVILLYTPLTKGGRDGHWFTLVVNRIDGKTQYILSDSGGNTSRLTDDRVNQVIDLLTGKTDPATDDEVEILELQSSQKDDLLKLDSPGLPNSSKSKLIRNSTLMKVIMACGVIIVIACALLLKQKSAKKKKKAA